MILNMLLGLILLCAALLLGGGVAALMAVNILRPPRMTDGKAFYLLKRTIPSDLGLPFEETHFSIREERGHPLQIAGWWIPSEAMTDRCVLIIHGYADAKVGGIAWAPMFRMMGFNVLAIDLRGHGQSGGAFSTGGYFERDDLDQIIDSLRLERPEQCRRLVLFGVSLGAAVAAATAVRRVDLAAVILDSPFSDYSTAIAVHTDSAGAPGALIRRAAIALAQWFAHADFKIVRPTETIPAVSAPLLLIESGDDPLTAADHPGLLAAFNRRSTDALSAYWRAENAYHATALNADPAGYFARVSGFLQAALAATS